MPKRKEFTLREAADHLETPEAYLTIRSAYKNWVRGHRGPRVLRGTVKYNTVLRRNSVYVTKQELKRWNEA